MRITPSFCTAGLALAVAAACFSYANDTAPLASGSQLDSLTIGNTTYQHVTVRSVSARSVMITHDGGMKSLLLRDLPADLQQRFGYSPEAEKAQEQASKVAQAEAAKTKKSQDEAIRKSVRARTNAGRIDQLMQSLGSAPKVYREVNLRPRFDELGFAPKNQGHRPSCAIFAVVSALEYQSAEDRGSPETYSEEYAYWATMKTTGRIQDSADAPTEKSDSFDSIRNADAGFSLVDVATGLKAYGIIPRSRLPYHFSGHVQAPPDDVINDARYNRRLSIQILPGQGTELVKNIVNALNAGLPVPTGMRMPSGSPDSMKSIDSRGEIGRGHAVTIVGYMSTSNSIEDTVFTFRNSWGIAWGDKGYGTITYRALVANVGQAVVIELQ